MKYVKRYFAVLGRCDDTSLINELRKIFVALTGVEGSSSIQLSIVKDLGWGFILKMRDYDGRNMRALPFALSIMKEEKGYLQCFAISGTLRALSVKLKEMKIE